MGSAIAHDVIKTLSKHRNDGAYELFWECVLKRKEKKRKEEFNVQDPKLPRQKKLSRKLDDGNEETFHFPSTPKDHYRQTYFQALYAATSCIKERSDQPEFQKDVLLQEMCLKAIKGQPCENEVREVCSIYSGDVAKYRLEAQLPFLRPTARASEFELTKFTIYDLVNLLQELDYSRKIAMSEVIKVANILLVMPATNSISEKSFSAMKRVKTYLRSTTTDSRMNHLMVLHVHTERVNNMSMIDVANEF